MATVPVTRTWVAGEVVTAAYMNNNVTGPIAWLLAPAICQVRQLVAQSIATSSTTDITFTAEDVDSTGMHSNVTNTARLTAVYPGWYLNASAVGWAANATGRRVAAIRVNGADINASQLAMQATAASLSVVPSRGIATFLNVGDYVGVAGRQESGGALSTAISSGEQSHMTTLWVSN